MKEYKPRDKITQKMTRDGAVEVNETKQTAERISKREQETDLQKTPEQQAAQDAAQLTTPIPEAAPFPSAPFTASKADTGTAERIMGHLDAAHQRGDDVVEHGSQRRQGGEQDDVDDGDDGRVGDDARQSSVVEQVCEAAGADGCAENGGKEQWRSEEPHDEARRA